MRIRVQLSLLMGAIVAPLALVAAASTYALYQTQREGHSQRQLERVRALRLALDTEILGTERLLKTIVGHVDHDGGRTVPVEVLQADLSRVLAHNPMWASIALIDGDGAQIVHMTRLGSAPLPLLDAQSRLEVIRTRAPVVSGLARSAGGTLFHTFIAVPLLEGDRVVRIAAVGIDQRDWLAFLQRHPIVEGATLTLNDQSGVIVARTLNNEQWVGKRSRQEYLSRIAGQQEGTFISPGLEGQTFYSAFSRLGAAPWTLGTGMPAEVIEQDLRSQMMAQGGGLLLAALVAAVVAVVLGRGITRALHGLAEVSRSGDNGAPLPIAEAESVRQLLVRTLANEVRLRAEAEGSREQAVRANKGKDEFLAMLAHELRNPLSAISASVALLEAKNATEQTNRHAQDVLKRQVQQMSMLVTDLLDAARANSGKLALRETDVDLAQIVGTVVQAFRGSGRMQHVAVHSSLQPTMVRGDPMRLEQVVSNLLDNACKFTPASGQVMLALSSAGGVATLTVADSGVGIEPALLGCVFDPFTQAEAGIDRPRGGLGLGLHVVKGLVESHGGTVEVASEGPGMGTTFTVRLPALALSPQPTAPQAPARAPLPPLRVVLVEDNVDVGQATASLLRTAGHDVLSASDGVAGLRLLTEQPPDVALIDVGLPGMSGLELARQLRGLATVLLALTAYGDDTTREQAEQAGFAGFLQKPFDLAAFERAVSAARARREHSTPE